MAESYLLTGNPGVGKTTVLILDISRGRNHWLFNFWKKKRKD